ncbi:MAG: cyclic nucleotide-binding domain-containing protein [Magnetococcales bacterium]|nr:cyclic nucleotide-binding domain-containing protein [Magnetococcales bacterium]MBF0322092.1 cyclic nucleotide-binding domain-containing protein [Magnetococcales bacterium]
MGMLRKIKVMEGIYWVEVPRVGLYVLCGCPADVVKHLMKKGLIIPTEVQGVPCETGPNAILLADIMLQNGRLTNLAEFPVLQMLYRQGMLLPSHPNNTGARPLLIGDPEVIKSQMQYIFRGNYGLVSEEEICATGVPEATAKVLMQIKLKFAFGKIRPSDELLASLPVREHLVEICDQVFIRRKKLNVYEFSFLDERVTVDMNLESECTYPSPYPLNFHNIKREYFAVIHSGQGDGWDINRPSMGSVIMFQGKVYLVDSGPNIEYSLMALGIGINEIEGIFHTHNHDDHFAGLVTLIRSGRRIQYFAPPLVRVSVFRKLAALLSIAEERLIDFFVVRDLQVGVWNDMDGLEVMPILSPHPVETCAYYFRTFWDGKFRSYGHLADIATRKILEGMVDQGRGDGIPQAFFEETFSQYLMPADVKKIDIGGGLIHGQAEDFKDDVSERIILAHTSALLTTHQKEIGSSAPFGVVDVLVPDFSEPLRDTAADFLFAYFPGITRPNLRKLLNNPIVTFNPGSIIIKKGEINPVVFLVLTGIVEKISADAGIYNVLSAGTMLGEYHGLQGLPAKNTSRSVSFVQALRIPAGSYLEFIQKNRLDVMIKTLNDNRKIMQNTRLFGENISTPTLNRIAQQMQRHHFPAAQGESLMALDPERLCLIESGRVELRWRDRVMDVLKTGMTFGEGSAVFRGERRFQYRSLEPTTIMTIPGELLREIPIVMLNLLESWESRRHSTSPSSSEGECGETAG